MNKLIYIIICLFFSTNNILGQENTAKKILDSLSIKSKSYNDIYAKFNFNYYNSSQEIDESSEGEIWIKDDMYKLNMGKDLSIINNGDVLWYFMKDVPEVQIMENDPKDEMNPSNIFTIYEKGYEYKYIGQKKIDNIDVYQLELFPKKNNSIEKFTLFISKKYELKSIRLHDTDGGVTSYSIRKFRTNTNISDSKFIFRKKDFPDVEVIDLR
tara:strand:- start:5307 stop:5942 length:636 start_codon:yes stop_codon:yes gene_type:complete